MGGKTPQELEMYRQLEIKLLDLLGRVSDRLTTENIEFGRDLIEAHGEYGVALEMICDWLTEDDLPISPEEYELISGVAETMEASDWSMQDRLTPLRVVPAEQD